MFFFLVGGAMAEGHVGYSTHGTIYRLGKEQLDVYIESF